MERLKRWFGVPDQKPVRDGPLALPTLQQGETAPTLSKDKELPTSKRQAMMQQHGVQQITTGQLPDISKDAKVTETGFGQMMEPVREMVLRVVPLAEGDCLSCKLIGTGACWGMSVVVALSYRRIAAQYTGFRRKVFAAYVVSLITGMTLLGTARLFDMSFFEKPSDPDGKRKSLQDLVREDFDSLHKLMSRFSQPQASAAPTVQTDVGGKKDE